MTQNTNSRIGRIIEVVRKVIDGDYSVRIGTTDKKDEIDMLAGLVNQLAESFQDTIAGQKKLSNELCDLEDRYLRLEENIPGMVYVFVMHPDGTFSFPYVNGASQRLFEVAPEELMRDATLITRLIHPDDCEKYDMSIKHSAETLKPLRELLRHVVNGEVRWYDYMSRPDRKSNGDIVWDGIIIEVTDRVKAEASLKKSQKELSDIISVSPVGIAIYEDNGQCISTNDSFARIIGASKQQVLEQNYNKIESWKKTGLLDLARTAIRTKSAKQQEVVTVSSFGKEVFLDCHLVPFEGKGLLFLAQSITERKRSEERLKSTLQLADDIVRHIPFGILIYQYIAPDKLYLETGNPEAEKMTGAKLADLIGKELRESWKGAEKIGLAKSYLDVMLTGKNYETDEIFYKDENFEAFFRVCAFPLPNERLAISFENITERKNAERQLRDAKAFSEKLIESANTMIVVLNAEGKIQVFNKAAEEITGYTRQELLGRDWFETLVPKDKYPKVWEVFLKSKQDKGLPEIFENPILTKAGKERFISWQNTEMLENSVFTGSISYGIDITERKKLEAQLLQSQKMEAVGQLTGGIAHDFNNMLSVILGHAELVKSGLPSGDPLLKSILEIENAGCHSRDITRQLLAFSRKQIIAPKTTNLNKLIINIKKTIAKLIGETIDLQFFPQQDIWNVRIDPTQVDQILFNLAVNARDAMPDGGALTIETSNINLDDVYCALNVDSRPGHYVLLSVTDDGIGMDKESLSHAFDPFYTTKGVGKGTGLGLATVYGIIKQNGGFITTYSEPGKGTTFKIHIPRLMDKIKEGVKDEIAPLEFYPATVLLVEDDDMVRRMTAAILKKIGYSVVLAADPKEALSIIEKKTTHIDLLITDVIMPQMNGTQLAYEINKIIPEIKVLFMSGYTENVIVRQGVLKEGIHFVQKPFSKNDLARKISEALEKK